MLSHILRLLDPYQSHYLGFLILDSLVRMYLSVVKVICTPHFPSLYIYAKLTA